MANAIFSSFTIFSAFYTLYRGIYNDMEEKRNKRSPLILKMFQTLSTFSTAESQWNAVNFVPRPSDIIINTTPKSGTTMMQQICHQLRTRGDESFDEISLVVPYDEMALDLGQDLNGEQNGLFPRCFKSHHHYFCIAKGAKYIIVNRNPQNVAVSFYHFFNGWVFDEGSISIDTFIQDFWLLRSAPRKPIDMSSYWQFTLSWWKHRNDPNVLWLFYEDIIANPAFCIELVADFMAIEFKDAKDKENAIKLACELSSLEYMQKNFTKFDDHADKLARNEFMGLPKDAGLKSGKVRQPNKIYSPPSSQTIQAIDDQWLKDIYPETGYCTYQDMLKAEGISSSRFRRNLS